MGHGPHLVPKPHSDPPEPKLVINPLDPKLAKDLLDTNLAINPVGPIFGHGPPWTNISAMTSGNHQRPTDPLSQPSPQLMGNSFHSFIPSILKVAGVVSKSNSHFEGGLFQLISLTSYGGNQKTLQGSQPPVSAGVGCQGIKYFNTPWTTQFIHTGLIQSTCMALAQLGHFIFHCVNSITHFNFRIARTVFPDSENTAIDPPSRINLSVFTYTGYLSSPGDFFPS
ncbi:hypothetical protein O181_096083 [Austropuccinia psidii MF-1]|uniref:Uncharacterized protein n=1 Tax=Austropuccinia psidii MF-1 TaxID=1389203 RepID=A0A9Q3PBV2_9BASI|nr:hypothetical protein [Austropuccinia psidii MF-1]